MNLLNCVAGFKGFSYPKYSVIGGLSQRFIDILYGYLLIGYETVCALANHSKSFLYSLFKLSSYGHYLSNAFHAAANFTASTMQFCKVPTWNVAYYIVACRFEEGRCWFCYRIFEVE